MNESIRILLIKYITGNVDEEERRSVEEWIMASPDNMEDFVTLKETWQDVLYHPGHPVVNTGEALDRLKARLQIEQSAPVEHQRDPVIVQALSASSVPTRRWLTAGKAALIGGILVICGALGALLYTNGKQQPAAIAAFKLFVPDGKMKKIMLPDSTEVWLNARTHFSYSVGYGTTNREVSLDGEGYFAVRHNDRLPFIVRTSGYAIRDIGTIFTIRAYPDNSNFETAVLEGKVEVTGHFSDKERTDKIQLSRNQALKIPQHPTAAGTPNLTTRQTTDVPDSTASTASAQVSTIQETAAYAGWKDQLLVFDGETFDEVARRLEKTFAVKISITSDQLAGLRYTGRFNKVHTISEALEIIKETTPIRYQLQKDSIIISSIKK